MRTTHVFPLAAGIADADRYAAGPTTRVRLHGPGTEPQIRAALTRVWRLIGQPITVQVPPHPDPVADVAAAWAAEHALAGIRVEHRTTDASSEPCVVVPASEPVPWCGCVQPPCGWCLDDVPPCTGCESPLCEDCRPPAAPAAPSPPPRSAPERVVPLRGSAAYPESLRASQATR